MSLHSPRLRWSTRSFQRLVALLAIGIFCGGAGNDPAIVRIVDFGLSSNEVQSFADDIREEVADEGIALRITRVANPTLHSADPIADELAYLVDDGVPFEVIVDVDGALPAWASASLIESAIRERFGTAVRVNRDEASWYSVAGEESERRRLLRNGTWLFYLNLQPNEGSVALDVQYWTPKTGASIALSHYNSELASQGGGKAWRSCADVTIDEVLNDFRRREKHTAKPTDLLVCLQRVGRQVEMSTEGIHEHRAQARSGSLAKHARRVARHNALKNSPPDQVSSTHQSNRRADSPPKPPAFREEFFGAQVGLPLFIPGMGVEGGLITNRWIGLVGARLEFNSTLNMDAYASDFVGGIPILLFAQLGPFKKDDWQSNWAERLKFEVDVGRRYAGPILGSLPTMGFSVRMPAPKIDEVDLMARLKVLNHIYYFCTNSYSGNRSCESVEVWTPAIQVAAGMRWH